MKMPGKRQSRTAAADATGLLGLESVMAGSLPTTLGTSRAPVRYTVEAVFTRRPEPDEVAGIIGDETREYFARHGYPATVLTITDRRLGIANTNLEELRDGLAGLVGERLAEISTQVRRQHDASTERFLEAADVEQRRANTVAIFAASVSFAAGDHRAAAQMRTLQDVDRADRDQVSGWDGEGGNTLAPQGESRQDQGAAAP